MTPQKILLKIYKNFFVSVGTRRSILPPTNPLQAFLMVALIATKKSPLFSLKTNNINNGS